MRSLSRRQFLFTTLALSAAASLPTRAAASKGKMRAGCQANGFPIKQGDFPGLLEALRQMKALGYEGFECNIRFVQDQFDRVAEARRQIQDTGMEFIGVHMGVQLGKPDTFPQWVQNIAALGGTCFVVSGAGAFETQNANREGWTRKAAALTELGKMAKAGGLRVAYHNHNPEFADHNAEMNFLADHTDPALVSFLMDAGHAHLGGGDPAAFMTKCSARILGCHLKTYKGGQKNQVPLGQGDWGFDDLAAAAQKANWSGWLIDEEGGSSAPPGTAALGADRDYIRRIFGA